MKKPKPGIDPDLEQFIIDIVDRRLGAIAADDSVFGVRQKRKDERVVKVSCSFAPEIYEELKRTCPEHVPMSRFIERAVEVFLKLRRTGGES